VQRDGLSARRWVCDEHREAVGTEESGDSLLACLVLVGVSCRAFLRCGHAAVDLEHRAAELALHALGELLDVAHERGPDHALLWWVPIAKSAQIIERPAELRRQLAERSVVA